MCGPSGSLTRCVAARPSRCCAPSPPFLGPGTRRLRCGAPPWTASTPLWVPERACTSWGLTVEVAPGAAAGHDEATAAADAVRAELRQVNSEFTNYVPGDRQTPVVQLRPA